MEKRLIISLKEYNELFEFKDKIMKGDIATVHCYKHNAPIMFITVDDALDIIIEKNKELEAKLLLLKNK